MDTKLKVKYYFGKDHYEYWNWGRHQYPHDNNINEPTEYHNEPWSVDLGDYNQWKGTREELRIIIQTMTDAAWDGTYNRFTAIGNLSLILGEADDRDFIVIDNSPEMDSSSD